MLLQYRINQHESQNWRSRIDKALSCCYHAYYLLLSANPPTISLSNRTIYQYLLWMVKPRSDRQTQLATASIKSIVTIAGALMIT